MVSRLEFSSARLNSLELVTAVWLSLVLAAIRLGKIASRTATRAGWRCIWPGLYGHAALLTSERAAITVPERGPLWRTLSP